MGSSGGSPAPHRGESQVVIEAATGRDRKTIRSYLRRAGKLGWTPGSQEPDEALAVRVLETLRPGPGGTGSGRDRVSACVPRQEQIRDWLAGTAVRAWSEADEGASVSRPTGARDPYSSLHRFAVKHCAFGRGQVTVRWPPRVRARCARSTSVGSAMSSIRRSSVGACSMRSWSF